MNISSKILKKQIEMGFWPDFTMAMYPSQFAYKKMNIVLAEIWKNTSKVNVYYHIPLCNKVYIKSICFGGGTPNHIPVKAYYEIFDTLSKMDKILEAFYTSNVVLEQKEITDYLFSKLPEYMIPVIFKRVKSFIQTPNGKIDRRRVLDCIELKDDSSTSEESENFVEDCLNDIQKKALEVITSNLDAKAAREVTFETGLVDIGIDSITFIKMVVALEEEFDFEFDDEKLFITAFSTIRTMIEYIEAKSAI